MSHLQQIGNRVKEILARKNMTQQDLAYQMGTDPASLCRWLQGKSNITIYTIERMESVLNEPIIKVYE